MGKLEGAGTRLKRTSVKGPIRKIVKSHSKLNLYWQYLGWWPVQPTNLKCQYLMSWEWESILKTGPLKYTKTATGVASSEQDCHCK